MKSTKYQLLRDEYNHALKQINSLKKAVEKLRREKEQSYYDGYRQGRFDEKMNRLNE